MKQKLNCILLIDDDENDNFYHQRIIEKTNVTEKVITYESAKEALDFLKTKQEGTFPQPDLIFLDINMPGMNGWEFLEIYAKLDIEQQGNIVVVMLTTSFFARDKERASQIEIIKDFLNKPLTSEILVNIIQTHFSQNL